jgi:hypothetical protein
VDCGTSVEFQVVAVVLDEHSVMKMEVDAVTKVFISNCENAWCYKRNFRMVMYQLKGYVLI